MALEALVTVTGAQPSGLSGSRDLFYEETATVLVFRDGAVIRLTAPVSAGQLLFLTNKKSKEEVVCQVLHKRSFQAAVCYVELQFTEERPNFWEVAFPKGKRDGSEFKVVEQVQAESTTLEEPGTLPAPHDAEAVDHLKKEVEALREQLFAVEKRKDAGAAKPTPPPTPANDVRGEIAKGLAEVLAPLMPEAADKKESDRSVVGMALPNPKNESEQSGEEARKATEGLLPDPAVKLSKMAAWVEPRDKREAKGSGSVKSADRGKSRSVGMSMLLIAALAGGALVRQVVAIPASGEEAARDSGNEVGKTDRSSRWAGDEGKGGGHDGRGERERRTGSDNVRREQANEIRNECRAGKRKAG